MKDKAKIFRKIGIILLKPEVFFLLIAFLLIQLWFSKNLLFGGTEVAIPTYTPGKILDQIKWTWWEALGPGVSIPTVSASIPFYAAMALLEHFGFGAISIQKTLFFILIFLQGFGTSLVFKTLFPDKSRFSILAGLFYIFNPFMMIYVWHRFMYSNFILSAVLPILIYFYLQLIEKGRLRYILYFLLASLASSYIFSGIAPVMAIWLAIFIIYITAIVINRFDIKKLSSITLLSLSLLIFWLATNLWWIYPLSQNKGIFNFFSIQGNVEVVVALSEKSSINNVIRGINPYNLFIEEDWGRIYKSWPLQLLSWIPFILVLIGLVSGIRRIKTWFMVILFIFGIFIAKGTAEPLGFINSFFYNKFFVLGAVKNPLEKLGLLVFLPASILIALGISNYWNLYKKYYLRILIFLMVIGSGIYVWPMWSDKLFGSNKYPPFFNPPVDYLESANLLSAELKKDEGKILHLPIGEGDSTTYLWPNTYNGADLANHLFPGVSISRFSYVPFIDSILNDTARIFHTDNHRLYDQAIQHLGVKYIVLNKDVDWFFRDVDNPNLIESKLDKFGNLIVLKETEHLKIYKYTGYSTGIISIPQKTSYYLSEGSSVAGSLDFMWNGEGFGDEAYLEINKNTIIPEPIGQKNLLPKRLIIDRAALRNKNDFIPPTYYEKYLPGSVLYPVIAIIEEIQTFFTPAYEKPVRMLLLTTKRLRESQRLKEQNKEELYNQSIHQYSDHLSRVLNLFHPFENVADNEKKLYLSKYILRQEKKDLEDLLLHTKDENTKTVILSDIEKINEFNKTKGFALIYQVDGAPEFINMDSYSYQFTLKDQLRANMIMVVSDSDYLKDLNNGKISLYIDGRAEQFNVKKVNNLNWFDFGEIALEPGEHEITVPISNNKNLISGNSQNQRTKGFVEVVNEKDLRISSLTEDSWVEFDVSNFDPEEEYVISFKHRVIKGNAPVVDILQDKDGFSSPYNDNKIRTTDFAMLDSYDFDWRSFETSYGKERDVVMKLARSTLQPIIRIRVPVWNNCVISNSKNPKVCTNVEFNRRYDKPSIAEINDLKITKLLNAQLFLKSSQNLAWVEEPKIKYKKVSPVEYLVEIDSQKSNFTLLFNESFHPGWKLEFSSGNQVQLIEENRHFLANGYANGWIIDKSGKIKLKIKFMLQEYLKAGIIISITLFLIFILLLIGKKLMFKKLRSNE